MMGGRMHTMYLPSEERDEASEVVKAALDSLTVNPVTV